MLDEYQELMRANLTIRITSARRWPIVVFVRRVTSLGTWTIAVSPVVVIVVPIVRWTTFLVMSWRSCVFFHSFFLMHLAVQDLLNKTMVNGSRTGTLECSCLILQSDERKPADRQTSIQTYDRQSLKELIN